MGGGSCEVRVGMKVSMNGTRLGQGMSAFIFSLGQFEWSIPVGLANPFS